MDGWNIERLFGGFVDDVPGWQRVMRVDGAVVVGELVSRFFARRMDGVWRMDVFVRDEAGVARMEDCLCRESGYRRCFPEEVAREREVSGCLICSFSFPFSGWQQGANCRV